MGSNEKNIDNGKLDLPSLRGRGKRGEAVIAIFDVGKTNKKIVLFDEQYQLVFEETTQIKETTDEDGFPCEDIFALSNWVKASFDKIANEPRFDIRAVNFSAYGASFVYVNKYGQVLTPLYNYLKPYPEQLKQQFYSSYGGESLLSKQTASPVLGNLNSGLQLYRLKYERPEIFNEIAFAFHLPQYLSYILIDYPATDITSIGCHTMLWDFQRNKYHLWVEREQIEEKFAPVIPCNAPFTFERNVTNYLGGIGLHDSSAALIPYLASFNEPFILLSTGTWSISFNPFNHFLLTDHELQQDCLCYLSYEGKPVKASRLFAGYEHEQQVKRLAAHFAVDIDRYKETKVDFELLNSLKEENSTNSFRQGALADQSGFAQRDLAGFKGYDEAYHQLMAGIIQQQVRSTNLVLKETSVSRIFVDGGFSNNSIYMHMLAEVFPGMKVYAASVSQASALGAALVFHPHWNSKQLPSEIIDMKPYSVPRQTPL